jgi:hypothetical protein
MLETLSPEEQAERGLCFPQLRRNVGQEPPATPERLAAEQAANAASDAFRPHLNARAILAALWYVADPLWLDLVVSSIKFGVDIAFDSIGPASASSSPPSNMFDHEDTEQLAAVLASMEEEIARGNATAFSPTPLFEWQRLIAAGVVPKKDSDILRFIKDYTERRNPDSINSSVPAVKTCWCPFTLAFERFRSVAGPSARAASWDCTGAFPVFGIAPHQRHLTVTFIPGHGYSHRLRGDMGLARCGFAWEILGGRLMSTIYFVLSPFTSVSASGAVKCDLIALTDAVSHLAPPSAARPPSPHGFCAVGSLEIMLSPTARALLGALIKRRKEDLRAVDVDLSRVSRWCDDFVNFCACEARASRNDHAVVFFHRLCGIALSPKKFFPSAEQQCFYGVSFDVVSGTVSLAEDKLSKLSRSIQELTSRPNCSMKGLRRLYGLLNFFGCVYPAMRRFSDSSRRALGKVCGMMASRRRKASPSIPILPISHEHLRDLSAWLAFIARAPRSVASLLVPTLDAVLHPEVVVHTDWSGSPDSGMLAVVVISHCKFACGSMDAQFYEPVPEAALAHSSPVGEATAVLAFLDSFESLARGKVVLLYTDSKVLVQRFYNLKCASKHSVALQDRLCDISIKTSLMNTRLVLVHVPTDFCLADPLTRSHPLQSRVEKLNAALTSVGLSDPFLRHPLSLPPFRT